MDEGSNAVTTWEAFDADQVMYGTHSKIYDNSFAEIFEDRGMKYFIPAELLGGQELSPSVRLVLQTRNYINYNELGQASIVDTRFVKIKVKRLNP